jgi:ABC-type branched-subunit amino acid transport system substrate-binding protein
VPRFSAIALLAFVLADVESLAQRKYDPGATDTEIKIGNIMPYTGAFSEYGATGRAEAAYFRMIDDQGGVNGRQIKFISLDSGSDTDTAVALAHQLVEQERVLLTVGIWGTPANMAIRQFMNDQKTPQLFVAATESAFDDPAHFPWTMGFQASKRSEGSTYAKYVLQKKPGARIAILYAKDPSGQEWLLGIHDGLGEKAPAMIVKEASFSYSDPEAVDAQIAALKDSGADVFMNLAVGRLATRAIRKAYDMGWHPLQFIPNASLSVAAFLEPAGLNKVAGIITNARSKSWLKPQSKHSRCQLCVWVRSRADGSGGAEEVRRRPYSRQCDEAGRQPRSGTGDASSRHQGNYEPHRLSADQAVVPHTVRRSGLGSYRHAGGQLRPAR